VVRGEWRRFATAAAAMRCGGGGRKGRGGRGSRVLGFVRVRGGDEVAGWCCRLEWVGLVQSDRLAQ